MSDPIERLEGELTRLGGEHEPKPGWQVRVLAATAEAPKPTRRPWWQFAVPALIAAAAIVAIVIGVRGGEPKHDALALAIQIDGGSAVVRGAMAKVGDVVRATATGGKHRAVWIYRGETELVVACPSPTGCTETATSLAASATLRAPGTYTVVAIDSDAPLSAPTGVYDTDVSRAQRGGARTRTDTINVR